MSADDFSDATRTLAHDDATEADQAAIEAGDVPRVRGHRRAEAKLRSIRDLHPLRVVLMGGADPTCATCLTVNDAGMVRHAAWPCATRSAAE